MNIPVKYLASSFETMVGVYPDNVSEPAPTFEEDGYVDLLLPSTHKWFIDDNCIEQVQIFQNEEGQVLMIRSEYDDEFEFDMNGTMDFRRITVYEKCGLKEKTALLNKFKDQV